MAVSLMETAIHVGVLCPFLCLGTSLFIVFTDVEGVIRKGVLLSGMRHSVVGIGPAGVAPSIDRSHPSIGRRFILSRTLPLIGSEFLFGFCIIRDFVNCVLQRRGGLTVISSFSFE